MTSPKQETRWVLRAQSGDHEALNELLKSVQGSLFRYIYRLVGERTIAEDTLQEVFMRIYRKLGWLQQPELFRPWAFRIASREAFKRIKREARWREQVRDESILDAIPLEASEQHSSSEVIEHLPSLIARVSPASRAVLMLHYMEDMPLAEVAEVLGIAVGTAKSRLAYGLATLRRSINETHGPSD